MADEVDARADESITTIDSGIAAFVRDLRLPRRRDDERTELPPNAAIGDHLEVMRRLGAGAKGVVYLARDRRLRRAVAVKLVAVDSAAAADRAEREAHAMARLAHPNVLAVHEVGLWHEFVYITMEFVDGGTLRRWQNEPERRWPEIVAAYLQAAQGLHAAHAAGLVHRDFKPDNVLIGRERQGAHGIGRVRVGDFGLARSDDEAVESIGTIEGTAGYMAPELVRPNVDGPLADQFSFGVSLFEALCGFRPYAARDAWSAKPTDLRWPPDRLPTWLSEVIVRAVELEPRERFPDLAALAAALEEGLASAARRRRLALVGGVVALAAIVGVGFGSSLARPEAEALGCGEAGVLRVWSPERRTELAEAFERSGSPIHERAAAEITARLDAWTTEWAAQRGEACRAARAGEQTPLLVERRNACLDRRLAEIEVVTGMLLAADRETVARSIDLVAELPPLAKCADAERLLAAVAPPEDPALADAVARARSELDGASAASRLGRVSEARATATSVRDGDAAARFPQLRAEAGLVLGLALGESDDVEREPVLEQAFRDALSVGDDGLVASIAGELVCAAGTLDDGSDRARRWAAIAESASDRIALPERERSDLRYCRAAMHYLGGEYDAATDLLVRAIAQLEDAPADEIEPGLLHDLLGAVLFARGRYDEARVEHERAIELIVAARGPTHPRAIAARNNLGTALRELGDPGAGVALHLVSLQSVIEVHGPESPAVLAAYNDLALGLADIGARVQAIAYFERAIEIANELPMQQRTTSHLLFNLSGLLLERREFARAVELAQRGVAAAEIGWGADHLDTAKGRVQLASALARADRPDEALAEYLSALGVIEAKLGPNSTTAGIIHINIAMEEAFAGRVDVEQHLAAAARAAVASGDRVLEGGVLTMRATMARERGDLRGARVLQAQAVASFENADPIHLRAQLFRLGTDDFELGDFAAALRSFERSRALAEAAGNESRIAASELEMARATWALGDEARAVTLAKQARARYEALAERDGEQEARAWLEQHPARRR